MAKKRTSRKQQPVLTSEVLEERNVERPEGKNREANPTVLTTEALDPPIVLVDPTDDERVPLVEIDARTKYRGSDLGEQRRTLYHRKDRTFSSNIEMLLDDGGIYVIEFSDGSARVPDVVVDRVRRDYHRLFAVGN